MSVNKTLSQNTEYRIQNSDPTNLAESRINGTIQLRFVSMDRKCMIAAFFSVLLLLFSCGCKFGPNGRPPGPEASEVSISYSPASVDIMPLTEFTSANGEDQASALTVYVSLLDAFDCQIKAPGKIRFELFEHKQRTVTPKGKRLVKWDDIELVDAKTNQDYWQDYLRAYKFVLAFEPHQDRVYVLEVTCLCPDQRRLTADIVLTY